MALGAGAVQLHDGYTAFDLATLEPYDPALQSVTAPRSQRALTPAV